MLWHCWLGGRKGIRPVKKWGDGGGGHWLVRMEWRPAGQSVCLPLLIFPCTMKFRSSLLAPAHPGDPRKRAVKWLWCVAVVVINDRATTTTTILWPLYRTTFSALTLLVRHPEEHPATKKNWVMRCWHGYLSEARGKWFAYGPADATAIPLSLASLKYGLPRFPGKEDVKTGVYTGQPTLCGVGCSMTSWYCKPLLRWPTGPHHLSIHLILDGRNVAPFFSCLTPVLVCVVVKLHFSYVFFRILWWTNMRNIPEKYFAIMLSSKYLKVKVLVLEWLSVWSEVQMIWFSWKRGC